tara:strand:- start:900 stop:1625 length:726 start_codon:yes stop_codon:yes gene_type:complete
MQEKEFEYIKGAARTNIPWFRPQAHRLNLWKEEFFKIPGVDKYKFWICGGVLENRATWDTDILVTGKVTSYMELQNIMVSATQLGLDLRQLIDINWNDSLEKYLEKGPCSRRSICCDHFFRYEWCNIEHCLTEMDFETIIISPTTIKNGAVIGRKKDPNPIKLASSLWKIAMNRGYNVLPSKKQAKRIKNGIIYKGRPTLLTYDLDFKTIIPPNYRRQDLFLKESRPPRAVTPAWLDSLGN